MEDRLTDTGPGGGMAPPPGGGSNEGGSRAGDARFLAQASRVLAASLDYEATLAAVAALALPNLGGWCIVDLVEPDGSMRRLSIVHPEPEKQELASQLVDSWPPERGDPLGAPAVVRTGRAQVVAHVDDVMLEGVARDDENLRILRALGIGSLLVVPLVARGHVLGAITFVSAAAGAGYDEHDLELAEDLAAHGALALDNARLFRAADAARRTAEEAERAKSQFLAVTSHELRTPLNAIIGYAQLMEMGLDGPLTETQREKLERIQASSQHLIGLVNEILDLARVEAGQLRVYRERGEVADAVDAALALVHPQLAECGHVLENRCAGEAAPAAYLGDPGRVRQILANLLANSCKFTPPGGRIVVSCGAAPAADPRARVSGPGPWTHVDVTDTGQGIAAEQMEAVFEPFVQAAQTLTRPQGGSGLGLAISRRLARMMGGDLTAESTPGEGSRFTLWLPAPEDAAAGGAGAPAAPGSAGLGRVGVLVLENVGAILAGYVARLRADPDLPAGTDVSDVELQNHALNFLSGVTQHLVTVGTGELTDALMRDTARIQRTIAELHGEQRRRLGWSEDALRRDLRVLADEVMRTVRAAAQGGSDVELERALEVLGRLFEQSERVSLRAWRLAGDGGARR